MNEQIVTILLWILGTLVTILGSVILGIVAWIRQHGKTCNEAAIANAREFGSMNAKLDRIIQDIGDHDSGLRGQVHQLTDDISPYIVLAQMRLQRKQSRERHKTGD